MTINDSKKVQEITARTIDYCNEFSAKILNLSQAPIQESELARISDDSLRDYLKEVNGELFDIGVSLADLHRLADHVDINSTEALEELRTRTYVVGNTADIPAINDIKRNVESDRLKISDEQRAALLKYTGDVSAVLDDLGDSFMDCYNMSNFIPERAGMFKVIMESAKEGLELYHDRVSALQQAFYPHEDEAFFATQNQPALQSALRDQFEYISDILPETEKLLKLLWLITQADELIELLDRFLKRLGMVPPSAFLVLLKAGGDLPEEIYETIHDYTQDFFVEHDRLYVAIEKIKWLEGEGAQ